MSTFCYVQLVGIVWGLPYNYEFWDAGIFTGVNGNSIWKVDGNKDEYEQQRERELVHGNGNKKPFPHTSNMDCNIHA